MRDILFHLFVVSTISPVTLSLKIIRLQSTIKLCCQLAVTFWAFATKFAGLAFSLTALRVVHTISQHGRMLEFALSLTQSSVLVCGKSRYGYLLCRLLAPRLFTGGLARWSCRLRRASGTLILRKRLTENPPFSSLRPQPEGGRTQGRAGAGRLSVQRREPYAGSYPMASLTKALS